MVDTTRLPDIDMLRSAAPRENLSARRSFLVFTVSFVTAMAFVIALCGFAANGGFKSDESPVRIIRSEPLLAEINLLGGHAVIDLAADEAATVLARRLLTLVPARFRLIMQMAAFGVQAYERSGGAGQGE